MIRDMWPSKKAKYDSKKKAKSLAKSKESTRTPEVIEKEMELCASTIGQKHHQIKSLEYEREQFTARLNELLLEFKTSREVHGLATEQMHVVE